MAWLACGVLAACTGPGPDEGRATAERAVELASEAEATAAVVAYQRALVERRGVDAAALVTAGTLDHYETIRQLALSASPEELVAQTMFDRLTVGLLRAQTPADRLTAASAADVLAMAVDAGLVGQQVGGLEPVTTRIDGEAAAAEVELVDAGGRLVRVEVRREDGTWKVDVAGLIPHAEAALRDLAVSQGLAENDLILATLSALTGRTVGPEVFTPPAPPS
jgi:hypothetical protein